jgi:tetratricopeptide (TPR) repeat protein
MAKVEEEFEKFARDTADKMAPGLDWEKPDLRTLLPGTADIARAAWDKAHPTNFYVMLDQAQNWLEEKNWTEAKSVLQKLVEKYPGYTGPDSTYRMLATVHRALGETNEERRVLSRLAERDDASSDAYLHLMELAADARDWPDLLLNARRYLAVNPLVPAPYRFLAQASEAQNQPKSAIEAYRALLALDPANPAEVNFKLGEQLHRTGDPSAKRYVLQALEEAPRYRDALRLLLALNTTDSSKPAGDSANPASAPNGARIETPITPPGPTPSKP